MSKRKGVNDIIYELDNDDVETSSEDEKKAKRSVAVLNSKDAVPSNVSVSEDVIVLDSPDEDLSQCIPMPSHEHNGGNVPASVINTSEANNSPSLLKIDPSEVDKCLKRVEKIADMIANSSGPSTPNPQTDVNTLDSVESDCSSNVVVGCENRSPLLTVKFRDKNIAKAYKAKVKAFMLNLIRLHEEESLAISDNDTDLELDIWPEDKIMEPLFDDEVVLDDVIEEDNMFFMDTSPGFNDNIDVPQYSQSTELLSDVVPDLAPATLGRRPQTCFNCDGAHQLRECPHPRNNAKIADRRKAMVKVGRYHVEDDQRYGHLVPGRISGHLRHALGLKRDQLPLYIYKMRMLGYPPGWLEEARISHSGIVMFDSGGKAIQDPEDEDGELPDVGSKDKFDIKKILDFPGFNVPASSRYNEEAWNHGLPPMAEQDSKIMMLQLLAPNAMKAYKRKKLSTFPSASPKVQLEGTADMELDDEEEVAEFPTVPPLPDEAPPPPPEAPPPPPPPPPPPEDEPSPPGDEPTVATLPVELPPTTKLDEALKLADIPVPAQSSPADDGEKTPSVSGRVSPSLADLEERKRRLLAALDCGVSAPSSPDSVTMALDSALLNSEKKDEKSQDSDSDSQNATGSQDKLPNTPTTGHVKSSDFGTPVMNIASTYVKLPSDQKFSKDICDVLNFENLPGSIGKYKKISSLLKKVKTEMAKQDS